MNWHGIKIGYAPHHTDLLVPGDRRRFVFYANSRGIKFEIAEPSKVYDIVYLTFGCDLSAWIEYKRINPSVKIIFELIDSYMLEDLGILTMFRGFARFLFGKETYLWFNHKSALRKMIIISDAVVCSTKKQKNNMLNLNNNIHLSLDFFSNDITCRKKSLKNNKKFKLVWEGQAYTVKNLLLLNRVFKKLNDKVELYIITDPVIKAPLKILDKETNKLLVKLNVNYHFINWDINNFSEYISNADLAIIPIASDNSMMWNKPENKLLLLWEIGIPTLTSDTPAYKNVMNKAGIDLYCSSYEEWVQKIEYYMDSSLDYRESIVEKANDYLHKFHNKAEILKNWDGIFDSLQINMEK